MHQQRQGRTRLLISKSVAHIPPWLEPEDLLFQAVQSFCASGVNTNTAQVTRTQCSKLLIWSLQSKLAAQLAELTS